MTIFVFSFQALFSLNSSNLNVAEIGVSCNIFLAKINIAYKCVILLSSNVYRKKTFENEDYIYASLSLSHSLSLGVCANLLSVLFFLVLHPN